jgi:sigma-B regulation protein RsbU (phosphoserine phosphatase)
MLGQRGYQVRPVPSGRLALLAIDAAPPDLILLDIRMPEMDGYQVCQRLKSDDRTRDIPIIFISALQELDDKVKAFQVGGVDYVTKPFQFEEVLARVETHLALRGLQVQLAEANRELKAANQKMKRELDLAGAVQTTFLPYELPDLDGWELAVALRPAGETSGDFYDVQILADGRLGVLVADVVGKGVGAALYMALGWALFRTCFRQYPEHPEQVLEAVNRRLMVESRSSQFLTAVYVVLDPSTGKLDYSSAGHCPPCLVRGCEGGKGGQDHAGSSGVLELECRGMPLGLFAHGAWAVRTVQLEPGDALVLYTDGITEARNEQKAFFGEERLLRILAAHRTDSARQIEGAVLAAVDESVGGCIRSDDITLAVVTRSR